MTTNKYLLPILGVCAVTVVAAGTVAGVYWYQQSRVSLVTAVKEGAFGSVAGNPALFSPKTAADQRLEAAASSSGVTAGGDAASITATSDLLYGGPSYGFTLPDDWELPAELRNSTKVHVYSFAATPVSNSLSAFFGGNQDLAGLIPNPVSRALSLHSGEMLLSVEGSTFSFIKQQTFTRSAWMETDASTLPDQVGKAGAILDQYRISRSGYGEAETLTVAGQSFATVVYPAKVNGYPLVSYDGKSDGLVVNMNGAGELFSISGYLGLGAWERDGQPMAKMEVSEYEMVSKDTLTSWVKNNGVADTAGETKPRLQGNPELVYMRSLYAISESSSAYRDVFVPALRFAIEGSTNFAVFELTSDTYNRSTSPCSGDSTENSKGCETQSVEPQAGTVEIAPDAVIQ